MFSRRDFGRVAFLPVSTMLAKRIDSAFNGVHYPWRQRSSSQSWPRNPYPIPPWPIRR